MSPPVPGRRATRQRAAVVAALDGGPDFRTAQELHEELARAGQRVGLTTVYRTLQALAASGDVDAVVRGDGQAAYRRCSATHHHHLVCRGCGRTVEVVGPAVETWADRVAAEHGFADLTHTLELVGTCAGCAGG